MRSRGLATLVPRTVPRTAHAGVVQWQNVSFPSSRRGFDSPHPLQTAYGLGDAVGIVEAAVTAAGTTMLVTF